MAKTEISIGAGSNDYIDFQLLQDVDEDGVAETAIDLSGIDKLELLLMDRGGTLTTISSTATVAPLATVTAAASGSVQLQPSTATFAVVGPYQAQFKIYETASRYYYVPNDHYLTIHARQTLDG